MQKVTVQLAYRLRALSYYSDSRFDYDHTVSLSATWSPCVYASIRAYLSYVKNESDRSAADYEVFTSGGGLGVVIKF
jgi:hypothetical protein